MNDNLIKKTIIILIVFFMMVSCINTAVSGKLIIRNKNNPIIITDRSVYPQTPDWISDNPHYSTGAGLADFNVWIDGFTLAEKQIRSKSA